jgi:outer membrane receptor protein involved in Fe transport
MQVLRFGLLTLSILPLFAQERTGSLSGTVTDATGSPIAGAAVRLRGTQTGLERPPVTTNEEGVYRFVLLPVGVYQVTATQPGFQTLTRDGITIGVNQPVRVDLALDVAATEQSITVVEDAVQVNTDNATGGGTIGRRAIEELPLNGRNFVQLGTLIPGAVQTPQRFEQQGIQAARNGFSVNGVRTQSNNFLLDGVTNTDPNFNGYVLTPPPDALEQFKIITSTFSAEYGDQAGSIVNVITRGGTNDLHGALWNFLRNDVFDARNFFAATRPPLRQNQFGASAGGPLVKDRFFLFGYYEGLRTREGRVQNVVVPTDAQRQGNFGSTAIRDPLTNQPFPNNVIPQSRLNPIAQQLLNAYVPNVNTPPNRFLRAPSVATDGEQWGARGDWNMSARSLLFARYSYQQAKIDNPLGAGTFSPEGSRSEDYSHSTVLSNTYTFSPTLLNEASIGFLRQFSRPSTWSGVDPASFGWQFPPTEPTALGLPISTVTGLFSIGDVAQSWTQLARNSYQAFDNISYVTGRHTVKAGGIYRYQQINLIFPNRPNGDFTFNGARTTNALADFLIGEPVQFRQGGGEPAKHFRGHQMGFYVQDDWKVARRLTINFGMRYELPIPYIDKQDRMASFQPGRQSEVRPGAPPGLLFPGDHKVPRATIATDIDNFAPRFGFAWDVFGDGRTAVRGGYGIFFDAVPGVAVFQNINVPPFNRFVQLDGAINFANPYAGLPSNPQTDPSRNFPCPCLVIGFSPDFKTPYVQQMQFNIQRQIARDLVFEVGYVGSLGRKLGGYLEVNPAVPGPGATLANTQQRRIYRDYNLIRPTFSRFNSSYHGLQARIEKRYSAGLRFSGVYTWSKAIDFQSSINFSGENRPQDAFSLNDVRGLAAFDVRHRFVGNFGYELPFFRGQRGVAASLLGGWQLLGIVAVQTGGPLTVNEPVDLSLRGLGADRPDLVRNPNDGPKTPEQWFDTAAFQRLSAVPGGQRSGTAGRNVVIGPGLLQTDLSVIKRFGITESTNIEFRAEFFNAVNHTNFFNPLTNIGQPATFGVIQGANPARIVQFALKFLF